MTFETGRKEVARELRLPDVPDELWELAGKLGILDQIVTHDEAGVSDAAYDLSLIIQYVNRTRHTGRGISDRPSDEFSGVIPVASRDDWDCWEYMSEVEELHAKALVVYYAGIANNTDAVKLFRRRVLGDCLLTSEQAEEFISSVAASYLSMDQFEELGIPVVGHESELIDANRPAGGKSNVMYARIRVTPPGVEIQVQHKLYDMQPFPHLYALKRLRYLSLNSERYVIEMFPESVLGMLHGVCYRLIEDYAFDEPEVAQFVLSGRPPRVQPITIKIRDLAHISHRVTEFAIQPWVSTETVARVYRHYQKESCGHAYRPITARNLALVAFVKGHERIEKQDTLTERQLRSFEVAVGAAIAAIEREPAVLRPSWKELMHEWNQTHGATNSDWAYSSANRMARDYHRTKSLLLPRESRNQR